MSCLGGIWRVAPPYCLVWVLHVYFPQSKHARNGPCTRRIPPFIHLSRLASASRGALDRGSLCAPQSLCIQTPATLGNSRCQASSSLLSH